MQGEIVRVRAEHQRLDEAAARFETALLNTQPDTGDVFRCLSRFSNALAEHLLGEDELLRQIIKSLEFGPAEQAFADFHAEMETLRWDWDEYLSGWDEAAARDDWELFAEHTVAMLARIRRRIARENDLLSRLESSLARQTGQSD